MNIKLTLALAAALSLTACGNGFSIGTESTYGTDDSRKLDLSMSKSVSSGTSANITTTVPATQLISQGMRAVVEVADINLQTHVKAIKYHGYPVNVAPTALNYFGVAGDRVSDDAAETVGYLRTHLFQFKDADPARVFVAEKLLACTDMVLERSQKAKACFTDFFTRTSAAGAVLAAGWPQKSPGFSIEESDNAKNRYFNGDELYTWLRGSVQVAAAANKLQHGWVRELEGNLLQNPDAASYAVVRLLFETPLEDLNQLLSASNQPLTAQVSPGEVNAPMEVFIPERNELLVQNEKGLHLARNGSTWFGDGHIEGYKTELALARTTSTNMERKRSAALDRAEKAAQSNKAGVNMQ